MIFGINKLHPWLLKSASLVVIVLFIPTCDRQIPDRQTDRQMAWMSATITDRKINMQVNYIVLRESILPSTDPYELAYLIEK